MAFEVSTPATSARFGFYDRFTLARLDQPDGARGAPSSRGWLDEPQGDGYSVVLDDGKIQVNLVKRWLDDALRVETAAVARRTDGPTSRSPTTARGAREGVPVYLDGRQVAH